MLQVSERQILLSNIEQFGRLIANATVQTVDRNQTSLVRSNIGNASKVTSVWIILLITVTFIKI